MKKKLKNKIFGRLAPLSVRYDKIKTKSYWTCLCTCGTIKEVEEWSLVNGKIVSCGCFLREKRTKHGYRIGGAEPPEYKAWANMKDRCKNSNHRNYKDYGGRGIKVCQRWDNSFENFLADMGKRPSPKHSVDRYPNPDGDYKPSNCRWATIKEQNRNKGKGNNTIITYNGTSRCISEWIEVMGLTAGAFFGRRRRGWSIEDTLTIPVKKFNYDKA
jgi:hypothetical protein